MQHLYTAWGGGQEVVHSGKYIYLEVSCCGQGPEDRLAGFRHNLPDGVVCHPELELLAHVGVPWKHIKEGDINF